jgi:hypothetical protein
MVHFQRFFQLSLLSRILNFIFQCVYWAWFIIYLNNIVLWSYQHVFEIILSQWTIIDYILKTLYCFSFSKWKFWSYKVYLKNISNEYIFIHWIYSIFLILMILNKLLIFLFLSILFLILLFFIKHTIHSEKLLVSSSICWKYLSYFFHSIVSLEIIFFNFKLKFLLF